MVSRLLLLLLLLTVLCGASSVQKVTEQTPTLEQCKGNIDLWLADRFNINRLSARQIESRNIELAQCGQKYTQLLRWKEEPTATSPGKMSDFEAIQFLYESELKQRYDAFLSRHGLVYQFYSEDEAGKH